MWWKDQVFFGSYSLSLYPAPTKAKLSSVLSTKCPSWVDRVNRWVSESSLQVISQRTHLLCVFSVYVETTHSATMVTSHLQKHVTYLLKKNKNLTHTHKPTHNHTQTHTQSTSVWCRESGVSGDLTHHPTVMLLWDAIVLLISTQAGRGWVWETSTYFQTWVAWTVRRKRNGDHGVCWCCMWVCPPGSAKTVSRLPKNAAWFI